MIITKDNSIEILFPSAVYNCTAIGTGNVSLIDVMYFTEKS